MNTDTFDLLSTVEQGGCSAKISPTELSDLLAAIPLLKSNNIMVDIETHDDAGVYRINDSTALIVTTDFFPPVCSSPHEFGRIAAANALSDVYAMGGIPLLALNLTLFPSKSIPLEVLKEILVGGQEKINEAGAFTMGGHTIENSVPVYGLAVVGTIAPDRLITNSGLKPGQKLILTKPLGMGVMVAAQRMGIANPKQYNKALEWMATLNKEGAEMMQKYDVKGATDVTGFGLMGHGMRMADASGVSLQINTALLPLIEGAKELVESGCVPGSAFRNLRFTEAQTAVLPSCSLTMKMICCDAQTSGGLLFGVDADKAEGLLDELINTTPFVQSAIIGDVIPRRNRSLYLV